MLDPVETEQTNPTDKLLRLSPATPGISRSMVPAGDHKGGAEQLVSPVLRPA